VPHQLKAGGDLRELHKGVSCQTLGGIVMEEAGEDDVAEVVRVDRVRCQVGLKLTLQNRPAQMQGSGTVEGRHQLRELKKCATKRIQIGCKAVRFSLPNFGRHVGKCAPDGVDLTGLVVEAFGDVKVPQFGIPLLIEQYIRWFNVTMEDTESMQRGQCLQALHQVYPNHSLVHPLAPCSIPLDLTGQVLESAVFHDNAQMCRTVEKSIIAADNPRMPERGQKTDFIEGHGKVSLIEPF
jgi:hypothetical protein